MFSATPQTGPTGKESLLRLIESNDRELINATFDMYHLVEEDVERLIAALKKNTVLKGLRLLDCGLTAKQVGLLCKVIQENTTLTEVSLEEFDDYPEELKRSIAQMKHHLVENEGRGAGMSPS